MVFGIVVTLYVQITTTLGELHMYVGSVCALNFVSGISLVETEATFITYCVLPWWCMHRLHVAWGASHCWAKIFFRVQVI